MNATRSLYLFNWVSGIHHKHELRPGESEGIRIQRILCIGRNYLLKVFPAMHTVINKSSFTSKIPVVVQPYEYIWASIPSRKVPCLRIVVSRKVHMSISNCEKNWLYKHAAFFPPNFHIHIYTVRYSIYPTAWHFLIMLSIVIRRYHEVLMIVTQ